MFTDRFLPRRMCLILYPTIHKPVRGPVYGRSIEDYDFTTLQTRFFED